jgi:hypothetical protein
LLDLQQVGELRVRISSLIEVIKAPYPRVFLNRLIPASIPFTVNLAQSQNDNLTRRNTDSSLMGSACFIQPPNVGLALRIESKRWEMRANKRAAINKNRIPGMTGSIRPMSPTTTQKAISAMQSTFHKMGI